MTLKYVLAAINLRPQLVPNCSETRDVPIYLFGQESIISKRPIVCSAFRKFPTTVEFYSSCMNEIHTVYSFALGAALDIVQELGSVLFFKQVSIQMGQLKS